MPDSGFQKHSQESAAVFLQSVFKILLPGSQGTTAVSDLNMIKQVWMALLMSHRQTHFCKLTLRGFGCWVQTEGSGSLVYENWKAGRCWVSAWSPRYCLNSSHPPWKRVFLLSVFDSVSLKKRLKLCLGFYFRNKSRFSFAAKKRLVTAAFLPLIVNVDVFYIHASSQCLHFLDFVYHGALMFVTILKVRAHRCDLFSRVGWPLLSIQRQNSWHVCIYKEILDLLSSYLCDDTNLRNVGA